MEGSKSQIVSVPDAISGFATNNNRLYFFFLRRCSLSLPMERCLTDTPLAHCGQCRRRLADSHEPWLGCSTMDDNIKTTLQRTLCK
jgi:hypothetical protein